MSGILFATPMYGGQCTEPFFHSVMRTVEELTKAGIEWDWLTERNESLISRARMEMTAAFLKTDNTHLFWIDADIQFEPEHVAKLWNLEADIGAAVYCMKRPDMPLSAWRNGKLVKIEECPSEPFEVSYTGTGFLMIKRHVIETLAKTSEWYDGPNGRVPALYMTPVHDGILESEDYNFCRKAREAGFKIIVDPSINLGHWGMSRYGQRKI